MMSSGSARATMQTVDGTGSVSLRASASTSAQMLAQIPSFALAVSSMTAPGGDYQGMTGCM